MSESMHDAVQKNAGTMQTAATAAGSRGKALIDNRPSAVLRKKANSTGLPDNLKSGIENLSGHSMDDVSVHYNSDKPKQLNAHAYAQGTDIHIASGEEKHLPHEAWHVVQQKQGRVKPTRQMKGKVNVNDDEALEKEADEQGSKAEKIADPQLPASLKSTASVRNAPVQRAVTVNGITYSKGDDDKLQEAAKANVAITDSNWIKVKRYLDSTITNYVFKDWKAYSMARVSSSKPIASSGAAMPPAGQTGKAALKEGGPQTGAKKAAVKSRPKDAHEGSGKHKLPDEAEEGPGMDKSAGTASIESPEKTESPAELTAREEENASLPPASLSIGECLRHYLEPEADGEEHESHSPSEMKAMEETGEAYGGGTQTFSGVQYPGMPILAKNSKRLDNAGLEGAFRQMHQHVLSQHYQGVAPGDPAKICCSEGGVHRKTHGLVHSMRQVAMLEKFLEKVRSHGKKEYREVLAGMSAEEINLMKMAMFSFRMGRQNETSFSPKGDQFPTRSAELFSHFAKQFQMPEEEIAQHAGAIEKGCNFSHKPQGAKSQLLWSAFTFVHTADLVRIKSDGEPKEKMGRALGRPGKSSKTDVPSHSIFPPADHTDYPNEFVEMAKAMMSQSGDKVHSEGLKPKAFAAAHKDPIKLLEELRKTAGKGADKRASAAKAAAGDKDADEQAAAIAATPRKESPLDGMAAGYPALEYLADTFKDERYRSQVSDGMSASFAKKAKGGQLALTGPISWAKGESLVKHGLTPMEAANLMAFTQEDYHYMNPHMFDGTVDVWKKNEWGKSYAAAAARKLSLKGDALHKKLEAETRDKIWGATSALTKLPSYAQGKALYRGDNVKPERLKLFQQLQKSGKPYTLNSFMSTSVDSAQAFKKSHVIRITKFQGSHSGVHLNPYGMASHEKEDEALFPPGSQFRIIAIKGNVIEMEALASKGKPETAAAAGTEQPPKPKVTDGGTLIKNELAHADNRTVLTALDTSPDGSCGIHAMLGSENASGMVAAPNAQMVRDALAVRIAGGNAHGERYFSMIRELIREICQRIITGGALSPDEDLLIREFHKVAGFTALYSQLLENHDRGIGAVRNERAISIQNVVALVKSDGASPHAIAVRKTLIGQIMNSADVRDRGARTQLETADADQRVAVLQSFPDQYLAEAVQANNRAVIEDLEDEGNPLRTAYRRSDELDAAQRAETAHFFTGHMPGLLRAYAEAVKNPHYYLREEDLREIAEMQRRNLAIYREEHAGQFVEHVSHTSADASGGPAMHVFHSGAHYEQARIGIME